MIVRPEIVTTKGTQGTKEEKTTDCPDSVAKSSFVSFVVCSLSKLPSTACLDDAICPFVPVASRIATMPSGRILALLIVAANSVWAFAQDAPPSAILGVPRTQPSIIDPAFDPFLRPLGSPDEPFRPFAPLGQPTNPACEGIGTRSGLGLLSAQYGTPGYGITWIPSQPVADQPTNMSVLRQDLSVFAPIAREGADAGALGLGIRNGLFSTDAILPNSGLPFPSQTWDIQAGLAYSHSWDNGWTTGAVVSAGSASDKPFAQSNVLIASLAMYTTFPTVGRDAWILGFSYIPTSDAPYPLPIVGYYWEPNEDFSVNLGAPFFLKWRFTDRATLDLVYVPIRTVSARMTWQPIRFENVRAYGAFNWSNEAVFLADRLETDYRFYSYEKRFTGGLQFDLPWRLSLDLAAGYVFDRFYFQGRQYSDRNNDRVNVGSGLFGSLQLRLKF